MDKKFLAANLHIHTTHSDGGKSVAEIIDGLKVSGVTTFAITDHDCIDGNIEAKLCNEKEILNQIYGIELSCCFDGEIGLDETYTAHILGYDFKIENMAQVLQELNEKKELSLKELCAELAKKGYLFAELQANCLKKTYIAKILVKAGYFIDNNAAYDRCLNTDAFKRFSKTFPTIKEGIALLKTRADGFAVWAHPFTITRGSKKHLT